MNLGLETETLEFKKSTGELKEAMNSICAMLNKHQYGELYFGVKPDGTPVGQVVTEESLRDVSHRIGDFIEPKIYPEISKVILDGRDCIHVKFEGNQVPYFAHGVAKIRVADEDLTMSSQELAAFIRKNDREENRWENLVSNKSIEDKKPIKVGEKPIKADKKPIKVDGKPIKADKKPIKVDQKPIDVDQKLLSADKELLKVSRQDFIVDYIVDNGSISNKEARELLGLAASTTKRILKEMVDLDILIVEGERKSRRYRLKEYYDRISTLVENHAGRNMANDDQE